MSTLFDEAEADAAVAEVLARHKHQVTNKERKMFIVNENEKVVRVTGTEEVNREDLVANVTKAELELAEFDALTAPAPVETVTEEVTVSDTVTITNVTPEVAQPTEVITPEVTSTVQEPAPVPENPITDTPAAETPVEPTLVLQ